MRKTVLACLLAVSLTAVAVAQDPEPSKDAAPTMEEMMATYAKYANPDEHHALLARHLVGSWDITAEFRMAQEGDWMPSKSTARVDSILGGRFFVQQVTGPPMMPGMGPFEGYGLIGYDRVRELYTSIWADNMGTFLMTGTGKAENDGTVTTKLMYPDPATKAEKHVRWVYHFDSPDQWRFYMYERSPNDTEYLSGRLTYKRITN